VKKMILILSVCIAVNVMAYGGNGGGYGGGKRGGQRKGCVRACCSSGGCSLLVPEGTEVDLKLPKEIWMRLWMDELAARDLYAALDKQTQRRVFQNIGRAEVRHRDIIASLLQSGGHAVPEEPKAGEYPDADMVDVYQKLLAKGQESELGAFQAGAAFEELDILELETELAKPGLHQQEVDVLTALRDASVRHLRAFRRQITRMGAEPEPTYLSAERIGELMKL